MLHVLVLYYVVMNWIYYLLEVKIARISLQGLDPEGWDRWGMVKGSEEKKAVKRSVCKWRDKGCLCNNWSVVAVFENEN